MHSFVIQMWRHKLGTGSDLDTLLFTEDEQFWLHAHRSLSGRFIFAASGSSETSEAHFIDLEAAGADEAELTIYSLHIRLRYDAEHDGGEGF